MLTPTKLNEIAFFANDRGAPLNPETQKAKQYLNELIDFSAEMLEKEMKRIQRVGKESNPEILKSVQDMYVALHQGRGR